MRDMTSTETRFDAASLEILWSRLHGVCEEMFLTLQRTSFSTIVSAALDYGCALLDARGGQLVHAAGSMPLFNLSLPTVTRDLLARFAGRVFPGDVFIGNDPWLCCGHIPDVAVMTPVFVDGVLVGFSTSVAHQADFGGAHGHNRVREVYEEGLLLPVMKLYERGEPNATLFQIIEANVRASDLVLGDLNAQVVANEVGAARLVQLLGEYGLADPSELVDELQGRSERAMRQVIAALPDGTYRAEGWSDSKGQPTKIAVAITVAGDEIVVDFDGTGPQLESGGTNCTLSFTTGSTHYELKSVLAPDIPHNEGSTKPITVKAPEGSILNCTFPASVNARVFSYHDTILKALAPILPDQVMAGPGLYVFPRITGTYPDGKAYDAPMFGGGGQGGSLGRDGVGGHIYPSSASNVSIELFEVACPAVVLEKEWIPDTAGAGQFRGGPAERITFQRLPGYEHPVRMRYYPIRANIPAAGMQGGLDGTLDAPLWNGAPVPEDSEILRDGWATFRTAHDTLTVHAPSGGGFGPPHLRDPNAVAADITQQLLTPETARSQYPHAVESPAHDTGSGRA
jgi:N-methylhydantoinase B/oxoprolinase/acetone carboxylase alpha subunit